MVRVRVRPDGVGLFEGIWNILLYSSPISMPLRNVKKKVQYEFRKVIFLKNVNILHGQKIYITPKNTSMQD